MGCFSFICKKCGKPIRSDSSRGENVHLFLLKEGKVIESMSGEYDSYGRVLDDNGKSIEWEMDWNEVCDLMFHENRTNGIMAIHENCFKHNDEFVALRSEDDPNQGWGKFQTADGQWFGLEWEEDEDDH